MPVPKICPACCVTSQAKTPEQRPGDLGVVRVGLHPAHFTCRIHAAAPHELTNPIFGSKLLFKLI